MNINDLPTDVLRLIWLSPVMDFQTYLRLKRVCRAWLALWRDKITMTQALDGGWKVARFVRRVFLTVTESLPDGILDVYSFKDLIGDIDHGKSFKMTNVLSFCLITSYNNKRTHFISYSFDSEEKMERMEISIIEYGANESILALIEQRYDTNNKCELQGKYYDDASNSAIIVEDPTLYKDDLDCTGCHSLLIPLRPALEQLWLRTKQILNETEARIRRRHHIWNREISPIQDQE